MGLLDYIDQPEKKAKNIRSTEATANRLLKRRARRSIKKKNKPKIPQMTYHQYLKSKYWRKRKNDYFGKFGKKCAVCSKKYGVTLHHKKYDNTLNGKEPDDFFVALCPKHHWEFHENHELTANMAEETDMYVQTARQLFNTNIDDLSWI